VYTTKGRTGFITLAIVIITYISYFIYKFNKILAILSLILGLYFSHSIYNSELSRELPRIKIWESSYGLIKEKPISGYGSADGFLKLQEQHIKTGVGSPKDLVYHTHNQILQSWLDHGIVGLLLTLFIFAFPLLYFFKKKHILGFSFWLIFIIVNMTEPMLWMWFGCIYLGTIVMIYSGLEKERNL
jgi:O-antigen ligase